MSKGKIKHGIGRSATTMKIFDLFIRPLLNEFIVPSSSTENVLHRKLEMYFGKDDRDIWVVRANASFNITGSRWFTSDTPDKQRVLGDGKRAVRKGDYLLVRTDAKRPEFVDIEFDEQVFVTRANEWAVLAEHCEFIT